MHNEYLMPSVNKYDQKMLEKVNTPGFQSAAFQEDMYYLYN